MNQLDEIVTLLDKEFNISSYDKDPSFSRFIPTVYDSIQFDWKKAFEDEFSVRFNGLMIKGGEVVNQIFLAVFPTDSVLEHFIQNSHEGDLLFMHHPLLMECGDPQGEWGRGFLPIKESYIEQIKQNNLSVYTCHDPLDRHKHLSTNIAIANELGAEIIESNKVSGSQTEYILYCKVDKISTENLKNKLKVIFNIPYVDFKGKHDEGIEKVAIVAGCGDVVDWMKEAELQGVQAYITGEIHCHIDNEYGKNKFQKMKDFANGTSMSLIGVSHSASEFLVHKTLMRNWFETYFKCKTVVIPQEKWWL